MTLNQAIYVANRITLIHSQLSLDINKKQAREVVRQVGDENWQNPYTGGDISSWSMDNDHLFLHLQEI